MCDSTKLMSLEHPDMRKKACQIQSDWSSTAPRVTVGVFSFPLYRPWNIVVQLRHFHMLQPIITTMPEKPRLSEWDKRWRMSSFERLRGLPLQRSDGASEKLFKHTIAVVADMPILSSNESAVAPYAIMRYMGVSFWYGDIPRRPVQSVFCTR